MLYSMILWCVLSQRLYFFRDLEDIDLLQANLRIDYKMALEMTYGILILEIIHRVIVCIFEVNRYFKIL